MIIDDNAWAFSPVALYIEAEPNLDALPNAVALSTEEATRLLLRVSETARSETIRTAEDPALMQEAQGGMVPQIE